ncbi:MAG: hypothetical protein SGBAC_004902 [Bacillariaceae sp.]
MEEVPNFPTLLNHNMIGSSSSSNMVPGEEAEAAGGLILHQHHQHGTNTSNPAQTDHHPETRHALTGPRQIRSTLYQLRDSNRVEVAIEHLTRLDQWLDMTVEDETRKTTAKRIVNYHGTTILLMALGQWKDRSKAFSGIAVHTLVNLSFLAPTTTLPLIANAGLHLILSTAKEYPEDYAVTSNSIGLLHNCAEYQMKNNNRNDDQDYAIQAASDECLDLVMETMKKWPSSSYHQERGCLYLYEMSKRNGTRRILLHDKSVCSLLVQTLEEHRDAISGDHQRVYQAAQLALFVYVSTPPSV